MRYVTHYAEYPIYEAAEGGYYYAGNEVLASERLSKRQAKKAIDEIWRDADECNFEEYGFHLADMPRNAYGNYIQKNGRRAYPWVRIGNRIQKLAEYIGEGESYVIERVCGEEKSGYTPYC